MKAGNVPKIDFADLRGSSIHSGTCVAEDKVLMKTLADGD